MIGLSFCEPRRKSGTEMRPDVFCEPRILCDGSRRKMNLSATRSKLSTLPLLHKSGETGADVKNVKSWSRPVSARAAYATLQA
jgi:hypothetical protein